MNDDRLLDTIEDAVDQQGDHMDMIHMDMGQKDVADPGQLIETEIAYPAPCIDQHILTQQKRSGTQALAANAATATQYLQFHPGSPHPIILAPLLNSSFSHTVDT
jgi:hypothetical protein